MANKHMRKCSTPLATRKIQFKATVSYHCTPIQISKMKKTNRTKWNWRCGATGTLICHQCGNEMAQLHLQLVEFHQLLTTISYSPYLTQEMRTVAHLALSSLFPHYTFCQLQFCKGFERWGFLIAIVWITFSKSPCTYKSIFPTFIEVDLGSKRSLS